LTITGEGCEGWRQHLKHDASVWLERGGHKEDDGFMRKATEGRPLGPRGKGSGRELRAKGSRLASPADPTGGGGSGRVAGMDCSRYRAGRLLTRQAKVLGRAARGGFGVTWMAGEGRPRGRGAPGRLRSDMDGRGGQAAVGRPCGRGAQPPGHTPGPAGVGSGGVCVHRGCGRGGRPGGCISGWWLIGAALRSAATKAQNAARVGRATFRGVAKKEKCTRPG
jgi:hypothetical protein